MNATSRQNRTKNTFFLFSSYFSRRLIHTHTYTVVVDVVDTIYPRTSSQWDREREESEAKLIWCDLFGWQFRVFKAINLQANIIVVVINIKFRRFCRDYFLLSFRVLLTTMNAINGLFAATNRQQFPPQFLSWLVFPRFLFSFPKCRTW